LTFLLNGIFDRAVAWCGRISAMPNNVKIELPQRRGAKNSRSNPTKRLERRNRRTRQFLPGRLLINGMEIFT